MRYIYRDEIMLKYDERIDLFFEKLTTFATDKNLINAPIINWDVLRLMTKDIVDVIFRNKDIEIYFNTFFEMKYTNDLLILNKGTTKYKNIEDSYNKDNDKRYIIIQQFDNDCIDIIEKIIQLWFPPLVDNHNYNYNIDIEIVMYLRKILEYI
jgi:hypothetical protein